MNKQIWKNASWTCAEGVIYLYRRRRKNKAEMISSMIEFIFRAFYFLRWIYTLIWICHGRKKNKKKTTRSKTNQASEIVLLLGGNTTQQHYLCNTEPIYTKFEPTRKRTFFGEQFLFFCKTIRWPNVLLRRSQVAGRKSTNTLHYNKIISYSLSTQTNKK